MSAHITLAALLERNPGKELVVDVDRPISVLCAGVPWICTAVLERTAILVSGSDPNDRHPVRHDNLMVDPAVVQWREIATRPNGRPKSASPWRASQTAPRSTDGKKQRDLSDERARKNQDQVAATDKRELEVQLAASRAEAAEAVKSDAFYAPDIHVVDDDPTVPTERSEFDDSFEEAEGIAAEQAAREMLEENARPPGIVLLKGRADPDTSVGNNGGIYGISNTGADQEAALEQAARHKQTPEEKAKARFEEGVARLVREAEEQHPTEPSDVSVRSNERSIVKFCPGCKERKPKDQFPTGKGFFKCDECRASGRRSDATSAYKESVHRNQELSAENKKHCPACDTDKPLEAFNRNSTKGDGLQAICRQCQSDRWTAGATAVRTQKDEKAADKIGAEVTPSSDSATTSEVAKPELAAAEAPVKNQAAKPRRNGRPPLTFTELLNDLRQLSAYALGLEQDNATLRTENEQLRDEQAGLYDELHAIVGGIKKATKGGR